MTQLRTQAPAEFAPVASLVADLDAIARIERSLDMRNRRSTYQGRSDFSRLARYIPDLKV